jgi:hypothetical protein
MPEAQMRVFRLPVIIIFLLFMLVILFPVSAGPELSLALGVQTTSTAFGVAADVGIGPLHLGAAARYHYQGAFTDIPYQEVLASGYLTTNMLDTPRINLQGGLGATSWLDFEYVQAAVLFGGQLRGTLKLKDSNSALVAEVLVPLQWFIWERNPPVDPDDLPSGAAIMSVYLIFQLVTVGWFWYL